MFFVHSPNRLSGTSGSEDENDGGAITQSVGSFIYILLSFFHNLCFLFKCQVSCQLRKLADKRGADEERFHHLANTVEAFTYTLLDPLRSNIELREEFGVYVLDHIIDDAIDLDQKKVFFLNLANCFFQRVLISSL